MESDSSMEDIKPIIPPSPIPQTIQPEKTKTPQTNQEDTTQPTDQHPTQSHRTSTHPPPLAPSPPPSPPLREITPSEIQAHAHAHAQIPQNPPSQTSQVPTVANRKPGEPRFPPRTHAGEKQCTNCGELDTPQWRGSLCNACALWKRSRGVERPLPLKFPVRRRRSTPPERQEGEGDADKGTEGQGGMGALAGTRGGGKSGHRRDVSVAEGLRIATAFNTPHLHPSSATSSPVHGRFGPGGGFAARGRGVYSRGPLSAGLAPGLSSPLYEIRRGDNTQQAKYPYPTCVGCGGQAVVVLKGRAVCMACAGPGRGPNVRSPQTSDQALPSPHGLPSSFGPERTRRPHAHSRTHSSSTSITHTPMRPPSLLPRPYDPHARLHSYPSTLTPTSHSASREPPSTHLPARGLPHLPVYHTPISPARAGLPDAGSGAHLPPHMAVLARVAQGYAGSSRDGRDGRDGQDGQAGDDGSCAGGKGRKRAATVSGNGQADYIAHPSASVHLRSSPEAQEGAQDLGLDKSSRPVSRMSGGRSREGSRGRASTLSMVRGSDAAPRMVPGNRYALSPSPPLTAIEAGMNARIDGEGVGEKDVDDVDVDMGEVTALPSREEFVRSAEWLFGVLERTERVLQRLEVVMAEGVAR